MPNKKAPASSGKRGRSAINGEFVPQKEVKKHPKTTVNETVKKKPKGK